MKNREHCQGELIQSLIKDKSPKQIDFMILKEDLEDRWFVSVIDFQKKSKVINNISTITMKDTENLIERYCKQSGFKKIN